MEKPSVRSVSHKGEKVCSYTVDFKLEVVQYAEQSSIHAAGRKYNVSRSSVRDWKKKKLPLEDLRKANGSGAHRRRLSGGGRKVFDSSTERSLIEWISERKRQGLTISGALIIKKAKSLQQEKLHTQQQQQQQQQQEPRTEEESLSPQLDTASNILTYSRGWLEKFMNRNGLALKNFPTYRSPVVTTPEIMKMEIHEELPTVIPLDDLLPDVSINSSSGEIRMVRILATDDDVQCSSSFGIDGLRGDRSVDNNIPSDLRNTASTTAELRESRSLNNTNDERRESRHLDNQSDKSPTSRHAYDNIRHSHMSLDDTFSRTTSIHKYHKNEIDDTYIHALPNTTYHKTREVYRYTTSNNTFHKTRIIDTYAHSPSGANFYKARTGDSNSNLFHKTRGENTYAYASPTTAHHKSRLNDSCTYTSPNTIFRKSRLDDSCTYKASAHTNSMKTRMDNTYTSYSTSNAFHKSRDMQTPIVIPLDDMYLTPNNKTNNSNGIPSKEKLLLMNHETFSKQEM